MAIPNGLGDVAGRVLTDFLDGIIAAIPRVLSGVVFLGIAYVVIRTVLILARGVFDRIYPGEQELKIRTDDGDLFVIPNREVEKRWRRRTSGAVDRVS